MNGRIVGLMLGCVTAMALGISAHAEDAAAPTTPAAAPDAKKSVAISGTVTIEAPDALVKPDLKRVVVYLASHPALDPPKLSEEVTQAAGQAVQAREISEDEQPLRDRPHIEQRNKAFSPDFLVVVIGTWVEFPNWDRFTHNVFSRSQAAPPFDLDRYPYGRSKSYQFVKLGVVQVFCNIHPAMRATVVVVPNRCFTRADAEGGFTLADVPPGEYELVTWHPRCQEHRQKVQVKEGEPVSVKIALRQDANQVLSTHHRNNRHEYGVTRGLAVKKEKLNLPVIEESHPACCAPDTPQEEPAGKSERHEAAE